MGNARLNALSMLSIEDQMVEERKNFEINHFALAKTRHMDFIFK